MLKYEFLFFSSKNAPWAVLLFSLPIFADWKVQKKKGGHQSFPSLLHFFGLTISSSLLFLQTWQVSAREDEYTTVCNWPVWARFYAFFGIVQAQTVLNFKLFLYQQLPTKILICVHVLYTGICGFVSQIFVWNCAPYMTARICEKQDPRRGEQMIYSSALSPSCSSCCQIQTRGLR